VFGGNGGLPRFINSNPQYFEGFRGPSGLGGPGVFEPPPLGSNGYLVKTLSTFVGIFVCTLTSCVSLGI